MTTLRFDLDVGVFGRLMQNKIKTVLVHLPFLPARGSVVAVDIKQGMRTVETVECTIIFAEHSGLQAHLYNVSLVRGNHYGATRITDVQGGPVELKTSAHRLRSILDENIQKIASEHRESIRVALKRKADLLVKRSDTGED
ncbi:TPA: hypothetical protein QIY64_002601 [Enterobacter kobei]|nr:hypothetical protein [Enterobacter kobei]HEP1033972.1 hypothetical protein [Enterobacter kobei]